MPLLGALRWSAPSRVRASDTAVRGAERALGQALEARLQSRPQADREILV